MLPQSVIVVHTHYWSSLSMVSHLWEKGENTPRVKHIFQLYRTPRVDSRCPLNMVKPVLLFKLVFLKDGCIAGYTTDGAPRGGRAGHILAPGVDVSLATYTQRCASGRQPRPAPCREHCRLHQEPHQDDAGLLQRVRLSPLKTLQ